MLLCNPSYLGRSAQEMIDQSLKAATKVAGDRLSGKGGSSGGGSKFGGSKGEVYTNDKSLIWGGTKLWKKFPKRISTCLILLFCIL